MEDVGVNKEHARLVIEALRSDKYQQLQQHLGGIVEDQEKHCCLGVICEVAMQHGLPLVRTTDSDGWFMYQSTEDDWDRQQHHLPQVVQKWLGIDDGNPILQLPAPIVLDDDEDDEDGEPLATLQAAHLNDDAKWDFKQIAAAMELTWLQEEKKEEGDAGAEQG